MIVMKATGWDAISTASGNLRYIVQIRWLSRFVMIIVFQLLHCSILTVSQVAPFVFRVSLFICFIFPIFFGVRFIFSPVSHFKSKTGKRDETTATIIYMSSKHKKCDVMVGHSNKKDEIRINVRSFWIQQDIYQGGTVLWSLPNCCLAATVVLGGYLLPTQECEMRFQTNTLERWGPERGECTWGVYQFLCEGGGEEKKINKGGMSRV